MFKEHLPSELLNCLHDIVLDASGKDAHVNKLIENFRYEHIHIEMSKTKLNIFDYYMKADEYRKTGLCEFAEALLTRLT